MNFGRPISSGVNVGGNNNAPIQNVVGERVSGVQQTAGSGDVRELLAAFRADLDQHPLPEEDAARDAADTIEAALSDPQGQASALRLAARSLPALVAGSAVQHSGNALATAIGSLFG